jgi:phosphoserine phosphatase
LARLPPVPVRVRATQLETEGGRYTGRVHGEAVCGPAKARAMVRLAAEYSLDFQRSYAYGDSFADRWMLARVGHPFLVQGAEHSSWRLTRLARRRGWPVLCWSAANRKAGKIQRSNVDDRGELEVVISAGVKGR